MSEENNYQNTEQNQNSDNYQNNNFQTDYSNSQNGYYDYNSAPQNNDYYNPQNNLKKPSNGFAIASLVTGILAIIFICMCYCFPISIILGIVSVILAIIHKTKTGKLNGMSIAGIICGAIGLLLSLLIVVFLFVGGENSVYNQFMTSFWEAYNDAYNGAYNGTYNYEDFYNEFYNDLYEDIY